MFLVCRWSHRRLVPRLFLDVYVICSLYVGDRIDTLFPGCSWRSMWSVLCMWVIASTPWSQAVPGCLLMWDSWCFPVIRYATVMYVWWHLALRFDAWRWHRWCLAMPWCFGQGICRYRPIVWGLLVSLRSCFVCTAPVDRWFVYDLWVDRYWRLISWACMLWSSFSCNVLPVDLAPR